MIIVKLMGGLGNQMFQYALGRWLADKHRTSLKLDLSFLQTKTPNENVIARQFELKVFAISVEVASAQEVALYKVNSSRWIDALMHRLTKRTYIQEPAFNYTLYEPVLTAGKNTYLDGYWQSEKYFKSIESILRKDFQFIEKPDGENERMAEQIRKVCSISLHVRRGDYVSNTDTEQFHGTCSVDYYKNAVNTIAASVSEPHFFIFSDDLGWVQENLKLPYPVTLVNINRGGKNYEDLRLMSLCRHHIIANSSFSWWGAWLNPNPTKIVITPQRWLNEQSQWFKEYSIDLKDIVPDSWLRINE